MNTTESSQGLEPGNSIVTAMPVVFVIEDDGSVRESLRHLLQDAGWMTYVYATAESFLGQSRADVACCLVLDVNLPCLSGLELQRRLAVEHPALQIVFITGYGDVSTTVRAMKAGAVEFLTKPLHDEALIGAVDEALERSRAILDRDAATRGLRRNYAKLTKREREVFHRVVCGHINKRIGYDLGISEITVKAHRGRVMRKMQVRSVAELVMIARQIAPSEPGSWSDAMALSRHRAGFDDAAPVRHQTIRIGS